MLEEIQEQMKDPEFQRKFAKGIGKMLGYGLTLAAGALIQAGMGKGVDCLMDKIQNIEVTVTAEDITA
jgi:hypothetical protein